MQRIVSLLPQFLACVFVLAIPSLGATAQPVTTSLHIPLEETVFVPLADDIDTVSLAGFVHVVFHVSPPSPISPPNPIRIHINLQHVSGFGDVTGLQYVATGASRMDLPSVPN